MDISIIIVTYNSECVIGACLASLKEHPTRRYRSQIVVVDNASRDDTVDIIRRDHPDVTLIESDENLGFGRGNNLGMAHAPSRFYYLHNADAFLQANVLDSSIAYLDSRGEVGIAGLPLVFPDNSPQTSSYAFTSPLKWLLQDLGVPAVARWLVTTPALAFLRPVLARLRFARSYVETHRSDSTAIQTARREMPLEGLLESRDVDWVCGAALILREEVRMALGGGFDPAIFLYGEDEDLCIEARARGWQVRQLETVPVIHEFGWGREGKPSLVVARHKADSLRVFIDKHFRRPGLSWAMMRGLLWMRRRRWGA